LSRPTYRAQPSRAAPVAPFAFLTCCSQSRDVDALRARTVPGIARPTIALL
jgi:hypothetical protein